MPSLTWIGKERELLAENGSLWMSIDDNEVHHARAILTQKWDADAPDWPDLVFTWAVALPAG